MSGDADNDERLPERKVARQLSISANNSGQSYEQVSTKEIMSRLRDKNLRKSMIMPASSLEDVEEDYVIEAPKSGLFYRDEMLPPLLLPTLCEADPADGRQGHPAHSRSAPSDQHTSSDDMDEIRELIFTEDPEVLAKYDEAHAKGRKAGADGQPAARWGLSFDSHCECGNLLMAESIARKAAPFGAPEEYDLYLRPDLTDRPAEWFLFRVQGTKKRSYRFHLHNIRSDGMRPLMLSEKAYNEQGKGWQRVGEDIALTPCTRAPLVNLPWHPSVSTPSISSTSSTLSFTFASHHSKDCLYFAFAVPYSYTHYQHMLCVLANNPNNRAHLRTRTVCRSLAGNRIDMLVITENNSLVREDVSLKGLNQVDDGGQPSANAELFRYTLQDVLPDSSRGRIESKRNTIDNSVPKFLRKAEEGMLDQQQIARKRRLARVRKLAVIITARGNGMETNSSWMCEGLIKFLLGTDAYAKSLRSKYVFYIFPMLNPDAVVNGFSRCDLLGKDLRNYWHDTSVCFPQLNYIKQLADSLHRSTSIAGYLDLRWSSKDGVFCTSQPFHPKPSMGPTDKDPKHFFLALAKRSKLFSLQHCSLKGRGLHHMLEKVSLSLAIYASQKACNRSLLPVDYARIGLELCICLDEVYDQQKQALDPFADEAMQIASMTSGNTKPVEASTPTGRTFSIGVSGLEEAMNMPFMQTAISKQAGEEDADQVLTPTVKTGKEEVTLTANDVSKEIDFNALKWEKNGVDEDEEEEFMSRQKEQELILCMRRAAFLELAPADLNFSERIQKLPVSAPSLYPVPIAVGGVPRDVSQRMAMLSAMEAKASKGVIVAELATAKHEVLGAVPDEEDLLTKVKELMAANHFSFDDEVDDQDVVVPRKGSVAVAKPPAGKRKSTTTAAPPRKGSVLTKVQTIAPYDGPIANANAAPAVPAVQAAPVVVRPVESKSTPLEAFLQSMASGVAAGATDTSNEAKEHVKKAKLMLNIPTPRMEIASPEDFSNPGTSAVLEEFLPPATAAIELIPEAEAIEQQAAAVVEKQDERPRNADPAITEKPETSDSKPVSAVNNPLLNRQSIRRPLTIDDEDDFDFDRLKVAYSPHVTTAMVSSSYSPTMFVSSLEPISSEETVPRKARPSVIVREYLKPAPQVVVEEPPPPVRSLEEQLYASFLNEMGLDYEYLFGGQGFLKDSSMYAGLFEPKKLHKVAQDGTYSKGFPQRHGDKGMGDVRLEEPSMQLYQYYMHIEDSLRSRQLVDESSVQSIAWSMFQRVSGAGNSFVFPHKLQPYKPMKSKSPVSKSMLSPRKKPNQEVPQEEPVKPSLEERMQCLRLVQEERESSGLPVWVPAQLRAVLLQGKEEKEEPVVSPRTWMAATAQQSVAHPLPTTMPAASPVTLPAADTAVQEHELCRAEVSKPSSPLQVMRAPSPTTPCPPMPTMPMPMEGSVATQASHVRTVSLTLFSPQVIPQSAEERPSRNRSKRGTGTRRSELSLMSGDWSSLGLGGGGDNSMLMYTVGHQMFTLPAATADEPATALEADDGNKQNTARPPLTEGLSLRRGRKRERSAPVPAAAPAVAVPAEVAANIEVNAMEMTDELPEQDEVPEEGKMCWPYNYYRDKDPSPPTVEEAVGQPEAMGFNDPSLFHSIMSKSKAKKSPMLKKPRGRMGAISVQQQQPAVIKTVLRASSFMAHDVIPAHPSPFSSPSHPAHKGGAQSPQPSRPADPRPSMAAGGSSPRALAAQATIR